MSRGIARPLDAFKMPNQVSVQKRISSITNAFVNWILPEIEPSEEDVREALEVLGLDCADLRCAYCGRESTEWEHFRPLIKGKEPTGYISEIQNLVPACGKCNQSKGNNHWRAWMLGTAPGCPSMRKVPDLKERITRLERFEQWREPTKLDLPSLVGPDLWNRYRANWAQLLDFMDKSQQLAVEVRASVAANFGTGLARPPPSPIPPIVRRKK